MKKGAALSPLALVAIVVLAVIGGLALIGYMLPTEAPITTPTGAPYCEGIQAVTLSLYGYDSNARATAITADYDLQKYNEDTGEWMTVKTANANNFGTTIPTYTTAIPGAKYRLATYENGNSGTDWYWAIKEVVVGCSDMDVINFNEKEGTLGFTIYENDDTVNDGIVDLTTGEDFSYEIEVRQETSKAVFGGTGITPGLMVAFDYNTTCFAKVEVAASDGVAAAVPVSIATYEKAYTLTGVNQVTFGSAGKITFTIDGDTKDTCDPQSAGQNITIQVLDASNYFHSTTGILTEGWEDDQNADVGQHTAQTTELGTI